jgi:hypothetical protein
MYYDLIVKIQARQIIAMSNRIDLGIKINYAQTFVEIGYVPTEYYRDYLEHINSFNSFKEDSPKKNGPHDFIQAYNSLIKNIKKDGLHVNEERIMLTKSGELINGAHRVSVAAALNLEVEVELTDYENEVYNFDFFQSKKLSQRALDNSALSQIKLNSEMKLIIVWPVANKITSNEIENMITRKGTIFYRKKLPSDLNLILNLKMINYFMHQNPENRNWTGDSTNFFNGIREHAKKSYADGSGEIRIYLVSKISNENLLDLKEQLRSIVNRGNYAVHSSDSIEESIDVLQTINHDLSLECARSNNLTKFPKMVEWLSLLNEEISRTRQNKNKICIGGSGPLGALGLRKINDLDIIQNPSFQYFSNLSFVSNHDISDFHYGSSLSEFNWDPSKNFSYLGFKFISLAELKKMKQLRNEIPKDSRDLKIIDKFEKKIFVNKHRFKLDRLKHLKVFWTFLYVVNLLIDKFKRTIHLLIFNK